MVTPSPMDRHRRPARGQPRTTRRSRLLSAGFAATLVVGATSAVALPTLANETGNELVGGFEIDGNYYEGFDNDSTPGDPIDRQGEDWGTPAVEAATTRFVDGVGSTDTTVLDDGHEDDPLDTWRDSPAGPAAPGASDIHNVWAFDRIVDGDVHSYFAWDRVAIQGQVVWFVELNQQANTTNANGVSVPNRTPGDLRVTLSGNQATLDVVAIDEWTGTSDPSVPPEPFWEEISPPSGTVAGLTNDSAITVPDGTLGAEDGNPDTLAKGLFTEFGFDISALFDADTCGFGDFSELNLRSTAGGSGAQLKDYVNVPADIESPCGDLTIRKTDGNGAPVGGATFAVTPNPIPGEPASPPLEVTDNEPPDSDPTDGVIQIPAVEPGEYTITETGPPPGYIGSDTPQTVNVGENESVEVTFENSLGSISWEKRDATTDELICCATFTVVGTGGAAADDPWSIDLTVADNDGALDTDPEVGQLTVANLPTGTYTVSETVPPDGYDLSDPSEREGVEISADDPNAEITADFQNPQLPTDLSVRKLDAEDGAPLAGAVFQLYQDADGEEPGDEPDPADTPIGGPCTTDADGLCTVTGLSFGDYFWYEVVPPPGFELPADRTSPLVTVDASNAGTEIAPYSFTNPRQPGATEAEKLDETDGAPLAGADFDLVLDDGDKVYEPGADEVVGSCTTGEDGTCTIEDLDFGTYFWVETDPPPGYGSADPGVSDPVEIDADNVDTVQVRTFEDPRLPSELSVRKLDAEAGEETPLAGAEFALYLDRDGDGESGVTDDAPDPDDEPAVGTCTTDDTGTCSVGELDFGTYYWFEVSPPPGYQLPSDRTSSPITVDASNAGTDFEPFTYLDPRVLSELAVEKVDARTGELLDDAGFALYLDRDGDGESGVTDDAPDPDDEPAVGTCNTGEAGDAGTCTIGDLDFGTYYWFETAAPSGYRLPGDRIGDLIEVGPDNAGEVQVTTFLDPQQPTTIAVRKIAGDTNEPLAGGRFELYLDDGDGVDDAPDEGDERVGECTTRADGRCAIDDLGFGGYYWYETKAPDGYLVPDDPTSTIATVGAANAGRPLTYIFVDPPEPTEPTEPPDDDGGLPDTGTDVGGLLLAALIAIAAGSGLVLAARRLRRT